MPKTKSLTKARIIYYVLAGLLAIVVIRVASDTAVKPSEQALGTAVTQPSTAAPKDFVTNHPAFKVFRYEKDKPISVIVSPDVNDAQMKSLLWYFRQEVQSLHAYDLKVSNQSFYLRGMISIFKNSRCANEIFVTTKAGPCGYGEHDSAYYQWGIDGSKDIGATIDGDRHQQLVFASSDNWKPLDTYTNNTALVTHSFHTDDDHFNENARKYAAELTKKFAYTGSDYSAHSNPSGSELIIESSDFEFGAGRDRFMSYTYPSFKTAMCEVGFNAIRLKSGILSTGTLYSSGC